MNFNASRNMNQSGGPLKAKRVSDVAAMGAPSPAPTFNTTPTYDTGFTPASPQAHFQQGIQVDNNPNYVSPSGDFNYMRNFSNTPMASSTQIGAMLQQPVVQDMALQYGEQLAQQGREVVKRELTRFVPVANLRYYFAVDTAYVRKKLQLILFPFLHKDWMVKFEQEDPVAPRYDVNAPDLYIPSMGYVTYVLLAGFMLGLQHRFSPEQIGMQASSALAYIIFEMLLYIITLYVTNTNTKLKMLDLLAFSGYKYAVMIVSLLAGLVLSKTGYYTALAYSSVTLAYFLVKTLRVKLLMGSQTPQQPYNNYAAGYPSPNPYSEPWTNPAGSGGGTKRRLYFLLFVAIIQPLLSWWLTYHLIPSSLPVTPPPSR